MTIVLLETAHTKRMEATEHNEISQLLPLTSK